MSRARVLEHLLEARPVPLEIAVGILDGDLRARRLISATAMEALRTTRPSDSPAELVHRAATMMLAAIYMGDGELAALRAELEELRNRYRELVNLTPPHLMIYPNEKDPTQ